MIDSPRFEQMTAFEQEIATAIAYATNIRGGDACDTDLLAPVVAAVIAKSFQCGAAGDGFVDAQQAALAVLRAHS